MFLSEMKNNNKKSKKVFLTLEDIQTDDKLIH